MNRTLLILALLAATAASLVRRPSAAGGFDPLERRGRQVELAIETRRFADALPVALDLKTQHPSEPVITYWLAEIYQGLGRPRDEASQWEAFMRLSSERADACPWLALAYEHAGQDEQALRQYETCVLLDPEEPERLLDLAAAHTARRQTREAAAAYARAALLDPNDPRIPSLVAALGEPAASAQ